MGDPTGYGFHGDFLNGWDVPTLQRAVNECTDDSGVIEKCGVFTLETDNFANGCRVPPKVHETITGTLDKLPGCNPVQSGPGNAVPQSGCGATTTIGDPMGPYKDVTNTKGFAYIGCGSDIAGQARTLQGSSFTDSSMTVEKCVDFCNSKGFSIAGLEYSTECYCDNNILAGRSPAVGLVGACDIKCGGDNQEVCGGAQLISLYKKCQSGQDCTNIL